MRTIRRIYMPLIWQIFFLPALFLGFALPWKAWAFDVSARVDQVQIAPDQTLQLQVVVDGGDASVDVSSIEDFQVLSRGTSTSRSYVNGVWSHTVTYSYILSPVKTGNLSIPPLIVTRKGRAEKTEPISIVVSSQVPGNQQDGGQFFAKASITRKNPVAGQSVVYTFSLFCGRGVTDARFQPPDFTGFLAREIEDNQGNDTQMINGQVFRVTKISYLLLPSQAGDYEIGPGVVIAKIPTGRNHDPFGNFFEPGFSSSFFSMGQTRTLRISSNSIPVTVESLPVYEGNGVFSGLVGKFRLEANLDKIQLGVGESATLTFVLSGQGNIMDAGPPQAGLPGEHLFKIYEDTPEEEIQVSEKGYTGKKVFHYALVPLKSGKTRIPGASLVYFDVEDHAYVTLQTPSFEMTVPGQTEDSPIKNPEQDSDQVKELNSGQKKLIQKKEVLLVHGDILDIRKDPGILSGSFFFMGFWFFVFMMALPPVLLGIFLLVFQTGTRQRSLEILLTKEAKKARSLAAKADPCKDNSWTILYNALTCAVWARAGKKGENLTPEETRKILAQAGMDGPGIEETIGTMETINRVRFGRGTCAKEEFLHCLASIGKLICLVAAVSTMGMGTYASHVRAETMGRDKSPAIAFSMAVEAYEAEKFHEAAQMFEALAQRTENIPDLLYNTGNAWLKVGNVGRAILWYERAKKYAPNDPDLRFNLEYARTLTRDKQEYGFSIYDFLLFWQGYVSLGDVQAAAIAGVWIFCIWAGVQRFRKRGIFSFPGWGLVLVTLVLFFASGLGCLTQANDARAVIIQDVVAVRSGTSQEATRLFDLHAGAVVQAGERRNGYVKIFWTKDRVGWVKTEDAPSI